VRDAAGGLVTVNLFFNVANGAAPPPGPFSVRPAPLPAPSTMANLSAVKALWESQMTTEGARHCANLAAAKNGPLDQALDATYYDMARVMYQIADYTKDPKWLACAADAVFVYRDRYVMTAVGYGGAVGAVPGHWNFTKGLRMDFERRRDKKSKQAVILLSMNAAGASVPLGPSFAPTFASIREVSYYVHAHIDAEALEAARRPWHTESVARLFQYLDQYVDPAQWGERQVAPFMAGLLGEALIREWDITKDARTVPALKKLADFLWNDAWIEASQSMRYLQNPAVGAAGGPRSTIGSPDLNLLIAPMYAWLWAQTRDVKYRDQADALFAGGVRRAHLGGAKQFNQNYRWSFDHVKWRG
jgi:hypothetical protein